MALGSGPLRPRLQWDIATGTDGARLLIVKTAFLLGPERLGVDERLEAAVVSRIPVRPLEARRTHPGDIVAPHEPSLLGAVGHAYPSSRDGGVVRVAVGDAQASRTVSRAEVFHPIELLSEAASLNLEAPLVVEGLNANHGYLSTALPVGAPRIEAEGTSGRVRILVRPKVVWFELDAMTVSFTWTGLFGAGMRDVAFLEWDAFADSTEVLGVDAVDVARGALPFAGTSAGAARPAAIEATPFVDARPGSKPPDGLLTTAVLPTSSPPPPPGPARSSVAPAALLAPAPAVMPAVCTPASPVLRAPMPARAASPSLPPPGLPSYMLADAGTRPPPPTVPATIVPTDHDARDFSDAAADGVAKSAARAASVAGPSPADAWLQLSYRDASKQSRVLEWPPFARLFEMTGPQSDKKKAPVDLLLDDDDRDETRTGAPPDPPEVLELAKLGRILREAARLVAAPEAEALDDRSGRTPLGVVDGTLSFPFDEREALAMCARIVEPLSEQYPPIAQAVARAHQLGQLPSCGQDGVFAEATGLLFQAFHRAMPTLPRDYLPEAVRRALLEKRAHPKRTLLGADYARTELKTDFGMVPTYIPEAALAGLPLLTRMQVVLVAELRPTLDYLETSPVALVAVVIARIVRGVEPDLG